MNWRHLSKRIGSMIADRYQAVVMGLALAAMVIPAALAQTQPTPKRMVAVSVPPHVDAAYHAANVKLHLDAGALPTTFKVTTKGGRNVTQKFNVSGCSSVPCDVTATLKEGEDLHPGWNYFLVQVNGEGGSAQSSRVRIYSASGVGDPTNGTGAPHEVHVAMTPDLGMEVDYSPVNGNVPTYYPSSVPGAGCNSNQNLTVIILDRSTLAYKRNGCYGPGDNTDLLALVPLLTQNDLVLASTSPGQPLGPLNMSGFGGTDFSASGAPAAYGYSIIGYGDAALRQATESYGTSSSAPWHGVTGKLVNVSPYEPVYAYQPTDNPGFSIIPGTTSSTITIGNVQNFPIGTQPAPNQVVPPGFTSVTYTSPDMGQATGGFWVLQLSRRDLSLVSSTFYPTDCIGGCGNSAMSQLSAGLDMPFDTMLFMASVGPPFLGGPGGPSTTLDYQIQTFGISPFAFDALQYNYGFNEQFSMVGIPNAYVTSPEGSGYLQFAFPVNPWLEKWYSSTLETQQGDTGALHGFLARNQQFLFAPKNVTPYTANLPPDTTSADTLLAAGLSQEIDSAEPVAWPLMAQPSTQSAYAYLSFQMISADLYGGGPCAGPTSVCSDIRFYYTSDEVDAITGGIDPATIPYPGDTIAQQWDFTQTDFDSAVQQLRYERAYLRNVRNYQNWLVQAQTNASLNVALALTSAGTEVATQLAAATNLSAAIIAATPTTLFDPKNPQSWIDLFNTGAALNSTTSPALGLAGEATLSGEVGVISGVLWTASAITQEVNDLNNPPSVPSSPALQYVNTLGDLLSDASTVASSAAMKFNSDMEVGTGTYFDGIYSDWFKLQTVGLMTVNPDATGWFIQDAGSAADILSPSLTASARRSFYKQALGKYFGIASVVGVPEQKMLLNDMTQPAIDSAAASEFNGSLLGADYSWLNRPQLGNSACADYTFIFALNTATFSTNSYSFTGARPWDSALGDMLFGAPASSDPNGTGNLNLSRNFMLDTGIMTVAPTGFFNTSAYPSTNGYCNGIEAPPAPSPTFNLALATKAVTVSSAANSSVSVGITLTPQSGFSGPIALSCSGLPASAVCNFANSQVSLSSGAASTTVTFVVGNPVSQSLATAQAGLGGIGFALCAVLLLGFCNGKKLQVSAPKLALGIALIASAWLSGCGGSTSGTRTPAGTYNVTITAAGSGVIQTQTVQLTIN